MKLNYINKIKSNIYINTNIKTSNFLEGTYKSIYKGKSMNFENLREYVINDDVKDIDWKASARNNGLLVKQFIAEKKHNILIVIDSGGKMEANTAKGELKKELALYIMGTIGYIGISNGDYVGMAYAEDKIVYHRFRNNLVHLEKYLCAYEKKNNENKNITLNDVLEGVSKTISKRMIIFVITDIGGLDLIDDKMLKILSISNDLLLININDNYMHGENMYDISSRKYIPNIISKNNKLFKYEQQLRENILSENVKRLNKYKITMVTIDSKDEINDKLIELLTKHQYAKNH